MPKTNDLLSVLAYDVFPLANIRGLPLLDSLMAIDIYQCLIIQRSFKNEQHPTEKQIELFQTLNTILSNLLYKEELDKVFTINVEEVFQKMPAMFFNTDPNKKGFIQKRLARYEVKKPELFQFLEELNQEIKDSKVSRIGFDKAA